MTATEVRKPLTERQKEIFNWLGQYIVQKGYSPTVREMCLAFGFKNTNAAVVHLAALKRKGWITWVPRAPRTIRVLEGAT
jgi:repressor LexA